MSDEGLLIMNDDKIKVTEMGRLLIRNIAMKFDGFIERQQDKMKYSRTI
jgi:oxygen-independent coproporphyrinogen-3 oxidase